MHQTVVAALALESVAALKAAVVHVRVAVELAVRLVGMGRGSEGVVPGRGVVVCRVGVAGAWRRAGHMEGGL